MCEYIRKLVKIKRIKIKIQIKSYLKAFKKPKEYQKNLGTILDVKL